MTAVVVRSIGPESAGAVRSVILPAFEARPALEPAAAALSETEQALAAMLVRGGGLIASFGGEDVGALVLDPVGSTMYLRRFGVAPGSQRHGVAGALIDAAVDAAHGFADLTVVAREELPNTIRFWERQGFREVRRHSPNVELRRPLRTFVFDAVDADEMRELGSALAAQLAPGDLIILSGELGAGKTTFTQGIGTGLGVRGAVTSPTFVIAREHPALEAGPGLVHVDAFRLGGVGELDDLDLDTSLDEVVTVVEWGEGVAEGLAESRLEVRIIRALADDEEDLALDPRRVLMTPIGPRWNYLEMPASHRPPLAEKLNENLLLDFRRCGEDELASLDPLIPLPLSLLVAERDGRLLMVRNTWSLEWELSGGSIVEAETARETAVRCLREETGLVADDVEFVGVATVQLGHERRIEYAALYRTTVGPPDQPPAGQPPDRAPGETIKKLYWWDGVEELAGLSPIDAHLGLLAVDSLAPDLTAPDLTGAD